MTQYTEPQRIFVAKCLAIPDDGVIVHSHGMSGLDIGQCVNGRPESEVYLSLTDSLKLREALNEWHESIKGDLPCDVLPATPA